MKKIVGFTPSKHLYYEKAFTHRSTNQKDLLGNPISYERLEFVGDAILSAVVAHYLFDKAPNGDEGSDQWGNMISGVELGRRGQK